MKKKHILALFTGLALMGGVLTACGETGGETQAGGGTEATTAPTAAESSEPTAAAENSEPTAAETPADTTGTQTALVDRNSLTDADLAAMSSKELAVIMGNGINLGNTMEATDNTDLGIYDVTHWETLWGQPVTTQEMIDDMKAAGIDTVRIPVAWTNNMDFMNGDYTIDPNLLTRVQEIVDYAYNADMFVVLNDHWDRGWWGMFGSEDEAQRDAAMVLYTEMWTQIANHFADYDHHLIFEGGNEEIGDRLNDITPAINPKGAVLSKDECYSKALEINQTFVDTVRGCGGVNSDRFLLIPGYGTDVTQTLDDRWSMPTDSADGKLFLSVHYYTPWSYCGGGGSATWGTTKNYEEMNRIMASLDKYGEDYGIIIGECGVLPTSSGELKPNTMLWMDNFYGWCDIKGYVPCLWNTGDFLNKSSHQWISSDLEQFFKDHSYQAQCDTYGSYEAVASKAQEVMDAGLAAAPETFQQDAILSGDGTAIGWLMWTTQDWGIQYSVGDTYDPDSLTDGLVPTVVEITGEGEYTIGLDMTGCAGGFGTSTAFSAIGISNGEELFPGYVITIKEMLINGEPYKLNGRNYTSSDDGLCTRSNLYNEWVSALPDDARTAGGGLTGASPTIVNPKDDQLQHIETIEITFSYTPGEEGISPNDANSKN